jgi:hypothetical protein
MSYCRVMVLCPSRCAGGSCGIFIFKSAIIFLDAQPPAHRDRSDSPWFFLQLRAFFTCFNLQSLLGVLVSHICG